LIGDTAFYAGLRSYYSEYRDSTALSEDFARAMSRAAGQDLDWYFRQALLRPGYPILDIGWQHTKNSVRLDIRQTQPAEWGVYRLPNLMLLIDGSPIWGPVDGRESHIRIEGFSHKPKTLDVDPKGWWLLKATVKGER
jgi:hypothetical protein